MDINDKKLQLQKEFKNLINELYTDVSKESLKPLHEEIRENHKSILHLLERQEKKLNKIVSILIAIIALCGLTLFLLIYSLY